MLFKITMNKNALKPIFTSFFWRDSLSRLRREKGKFILSALTSAILICCIAGYLGNLYASNQALEQAGDVFPVRLQVYNKNGHHRQDLQITARTYEGLLALGVRDPAYTAAAQATDPNGSAFATVCALNSDKVLENLSATADFAEGYDASCLEGSSAVCLMTAEFMESSGISVGDTVSYNFSVLRLNKAGENPQYEEVGELSLKVVGAVTYSAGAVVADNLVVPIRWLWEREQAAGLENFCDSFEGFVADPLNLNEFKDALHGCGLGVIDPNAKEALSGSALMIDDKKFIENAESLTETIELLEQYLVPFLLLVLLSVGIISFLVFRSDRKAMAISVSLGRPPIICGLSYFVSILAADLVGALIVLPAVWVLVGGGLLILGIYALYFLCVSIGIGGCLWAMFRSDVWQLLSRVD